MKDQPACKVNLLWSLDKTVRTSRSKNHCPWPIRSCGDRFLEALLSSVLPNWHQETNLHAHCSAGWQSLLATVALILSAIFL